MKILLFSGSLRVGSINKKVIRFTDKVLKNNSEVEATIIDLKSLDIPVYDGDVESLGIPEGVQILAKKIAESDALIISSPEYNGSISSPLKNVIDWLSRVKPMPLSHKPVLMLGASPGSLGASRGLAHSRAPFEVLNNYLYPEAMGFKYADQAFDDNEYLKDLELVEKLTKLLNKFIKFAEKFK